MKASSGCDGKGEFLLADMHAYVDNAMTPVERKVFEQKLANAPAVAERVAAYRLQKEMLRQSHESVLEEEIPQRLLDAVYGRQAAMPHTDGLWRRIGTAMWAQPSLRFAMMAGLCLASVYAGWTARDVREVWNAPVVTASDVAPVETVDAAAGLPFSPEEVEASSAIMSEAVPMIVPAIVNIGANGLSAVSSTSSEGGAGVEEITPAPPSDFSPEDIRQDF